jgi:hypothetical protein
MPFFDAIRIGASGAADSAFTVDRSLRFNDSDNTYLNRTPSSASNRRTWTWSGWIKRCTFGAVQDLFSAYDGSGYNIIRIGSNDQLNFQSNSAAIKLTNAKLRDPSAWYHIVVSVDTTNSTAADRVIIYINSTRQTLETDNSVSQNTDYAFNTTNAHTLGVYANGSSYDFDGYMAEVNFIDGLQLTPSSFGETNATTGQWNPKDTGSLTFGTNGFRLQLSDNSGTTATTLGKDTSGNGNNFTPYNFSVSAGEGNDSVEDTPTNNFCTLNPLDTAAAITTQNGNLQIADSSTGNYNGIRASFGSKTGKYYWEIKFPNTGYISAIGIARSDGQISNGNQPTYRIVLGLGSWFTSYNSNNVNTYVNANPTSDYNDWTGASNYSTDDIYMIAVDFDAGKIWWGKNNSWFNNTGTANPATGTDPRHTFTTGNEWFPYSQEGDSSSCNQSYNFGQQGFAYTPPTGFVALSSANLPDPTILLPDKHFDTLLYTGTDSAASRTLTGLNFSPDWVWQKRRDGTNWHGLHDSVRGGGESLYSNDTSAEANTNQYGYLSAFTSDGFTWSPGSTNNSDGNETGGTFVSWCWNAGDSDGKTYTVTVVDDSGNKYRFDGFGTSAVTLDLAEGGTYIFNYPSAHPFRFSTTADGTHGGGSEYTTGVTHNSSTQVTIVVAASAPTLYYYCSSHSGMGGQVNTNSTTGSSNFDGTIQSTVKANTSAGFSVVSFTSDGTSLTAGHGLGVSPDVIIKKQRNASSDWYVFHKSLAVTETIKLNDTSAKSTSSDFANTSPTSTVFSSYTTGVSGRQIIAYCFSEVAGYSKFGRYTGVSSADGAFIYTGFRPAWLMVKIVTSYDDWYMVDNKRDPFNVMDHRLFADTASAEGGIGQEHVDFVSNGFKFRRDKTPFNDGNYDYVYFAFAEAPFRNARAR